VQLAKTGLTVRFDELLMRPSASFRDVEGIGRLPPPRQFICRPVWPSWAGHRDAIDASLARPRCLFDISPTEIGNEVAEPVALNRDVVP
jgi:hypothetical protein